MNRKIVKLELFLAVFVCLISLSGFNKTAQAENKIINRMKLSIMPEYDSDGVLVIQEGKFLDIASFPAPLAFNIPTGVTKLTDVCSLSPKGHHYCQLFDVEKGQDHNVVKMVLPYPDFFIDFKYKPFVIKPASTRSFSYTLNPKYDIKTLEVHIQKPARSKKFKVPGGFSKTYTKDDLEYTEYIYKDVKAGENKTFDISYYKKDVKPSVEVQLMAMGENSLFQKNSGEIMLAVGALALLLLVIYRKKKASKEIGV